MRLCNCTICLVCTCIPCVHTVYFFCTICTQSVRVMCINRWAGSQSEIPLFLITQWVKYFLDTHTNFLICIVKISRDFLKIIIIYWRGWLIADVFFGMGGGWGEILMVANRRGVGVKNFKNLPTS